MNDLDAKALSTVLDYLAKTILAAKTEILAELRKKKPGPQPIPTSIKLQRATRTNHKLRKENKELHALLEKQVNQLQK